MSAGPAPPNSGAGAPKTRGPQSICHDPARPLRSSNPPRRTRRRLCVRLLRHTRPQVQKAPPTTNPPRTPGVRNVEQAYANGGGTTTHQPAYGGSTQGNRGADGLRQGAATGLNDGMNSEHIGEEQRLV